MGKYVEGLIDRLTDEVCDELSKQEESSMYSADQAEAFRITRFLHKVADELREYAEGKMKPSWLNDADRFGFTSGRSPTWRIVAGIYEEQAALVEWLIKQIEEGKHR